jgi:phosphoglycolate phosphatase
VKKLVLFDIDGTILLTWGAGRRAIVAAIAEEVGDDTALRRIRFDGKTDPEIVTELLETAHEPQQATPSRIESICRRYVELLARELELPTTRTTVMPGIMELLERLERQEGVLLGLLTGNVEQGAALKLHAAGIDPCRFRVGAYGSDAAHRPDLPPIATRRASRFFGREPAGSEVVIIGDTPADIACGQCVDARAVAVATGGYSLQDLEDCRPYAAFADLRDTERVLDSILQA